MGADVIEIKVEVPASHIKQVLNYIRDNLNNTTEDPQIEIQTKEDKTQIEIEYWSNDYQGLLLGTLMGYLQDCPEFYVEGYFDIAYDDMDSQTEYIKLLKTEKVQLFFTMGITRDVVHPFEWGAVYLKAPILTGFVSRDTSKEELIQALRKLLSGTKFYPKDASKLQNKWRVTISSEDAEDSMEVIEAAFTLYFSD